MSIKIKFLLKMLSVAIIASLCFNVTYASSSIGVLGDLRDLAGISVATDSFISLDEDEVAKNMLSDLITELRPFLSEVIDDSVDKDHTFTASEALKIMASNPIKFLTALYNYVVYSIKEVFSIAEEYSTVDVEVVK